VSEPIDPVAVDPVAVDPVAAVGAVLTDLRAAGDPDRAAAMAAYMRGQFPFLGVPTPERRRRSRPLVSAARRMLPGDSVTAVDLLWEQVEREFQYVGSDVARAAVRNWGPAQLADLRRWVTTGSWWDTVDTLAHAVGDLVATHPTLSPQMDRWVEDPDPWVARVAILHQLGWKERTDPVRLFAACAARADDTEFFIRKAIGWALRDYARTDPDGVRRFVAAHPELSGLSRREALKHLGGAPARRSR
jgi:3-methyladenine DNA glycosylase AlkD